MKPETVLSLFCRACGQAHHHATTDADAIAVECAFRDGDPVLSFQAFDTEGLIRTISMDRADVRKIQRAPLTSSEAATLQRKIAKLPTLTATLPGVTPAKFAFAPATPVEGRKGKR